MIYAGVKIGYSSFTMLGLLLFKVHSVKHGFVNELFYFL